MQVATAIANLFNDDDSKQKEIENLQRRIDQLQWELDNADTVRLQNNVGDAVQKLRDIYAETTPGGIASASHITAVRQLMDTDDRPDALR